MPKGAARKKRRKGDAWTGADHADRTIKNYDKRAAKSKLSYKDRRAAVLSRGSQDKIDSGKLRLHITKTQREVDRMRERLQAWDDVKEQQQQQQWQQQEKDEPRKKKGRLGPETWKLRGAARPAWEVYDFDTRYVDPHVKAHEEAKKKAQRCRNLLLIYKGKFGNDDGPPQPACRNYLALLMQLGMLCLQAKKFKGARLAFLECMDLDGTDSSITTARCRLMRMYLEANRPDSARRLWERLPKDTSVWIRYSAALLEYVSWKLLQEPGSSRQTAEALLAQAIRANVFCAYYLAYHDTFERVMEYTEEIQDAHEQTLEEAIEYCCSEQMGAWAGTEGAIQWLRRVIVRALTGRTKRDTNDGLVRSDLEWSEKLKQFENDFEAAAKTQEQGHDETGTSEQKWPDEEEEEEADLLMYAGMFRTSMDMLEDAGEFAKEVQDSTDEDEGADHEEESQAESRSGTESSGDYTSGGPDASDDSSNS